MIPAFDNTAQSVRRAHDPSWSAPDSAPNPYELEDMLLDAEGLALALRYLLADENGDVAFASRVLIDCILERLVAAQEAKPRAKAAMGTGA